MLKLTFAECVIPPPLAVIVRVYVPVDEFLLVETVNVEVPEPLTDVGLKDALVRLGTPVAEKLTLDEKGPRAVIVTVYEVFEPRRTV